jgi:hypothetical protein
MTGRRARLWVEAGLGIVSVILLGLTLAAPDWIEAVFHVDPDQHSGSLEWAIDGLLLAAAVAAGAVARHESRRPRLGAGAEPASPSSHPR